jgi:hypothetical protein
VSCNACTVKIYNTKKYIDQAFLVKIELFFLEKQPKYFAMYFWNLKMNNVNNTLIGRKFVQAGHPGQTAIL